tara:strand:- start:1299 stop:1811 length:513 start_codon:yes stop_codon:yes gene_type:complete
MQFGNSNFSYVYDQVKKFPFIKIPLYYIPVFISLWYYPKETILISSTFAIFQSLDEETIRRAQNPDYRNELWEEEFSDEDQDEKETVDSEQDQDEKEIVEKEPVNSEQDKTVEKEEDNVEAEENKTNESDSIEGEDSSESTEESKEEDYNLVDTEEDNLPRKKSWGLFGW